MVKAVGYLLVMREIITDESPCREDKVHRVNTGHTVFKILAEPVAGKLKSIKVAERDQKTRKHKENSYPNMELIKKTLHSMGKVLIKRVGVMRYKNQVCRQRPHARKRRYVVK